MGDNVYVVAESQDVAVIYKDDFVSEFFLLFLSCKKKKKRLTAYIHIFVLGTSGYSVENLLAFL